MEASNLQTCTPVADQASHGEREEDAEARSTREYSTAGGRGLPDEEIAELQEYVRDVQPFERYKQLDAVPFIYETMWKQGWRPRIMRTVDHWTGVGRPMVPSATPSANACNQNKASSRTD